MNSPVMRRVLAGLAAAVLAVIYVPLILVVVNSFNTSKVFAWPPPSFTTQWWVRAWESSGARDAVWVSVRVALIATVIALILGTMASLAVQRFNFFGKDTVSLLNSMPTRFRSGNR